MSSQASPPDTSSTSSKKKSEKPHPDPALKWGITPGKNSRLPGDPPEYTPQEDCYSPEEQAKRAKLRAKGVNPDLKAQMDAAVYGKEGQKKGFWAKVAGTAWGGGVIR